jgi:hypothetical protein
MTWNRITPRGGVRRALASAAVLLAVALAGCGGAGSTTTAVPDKAADAETLNRVLSRQLAVASAYQRILPRLRGADLAVARQFHAQEQEHVDGILRALRGLGAKPEPEEEEIEAEGLRTRADVLDFLYEIESVSIEDGLHAIAGLTSQRALLGSIVANQAQHLVLLRRALGAGPLASIPEAFENGTAPAPGQGHGN